VDLDVAEDVKHKAAKVLRSVIEAEGWIINPSRTVADSGPTGSAGSPPSEVDVGLHLKRRPGLPRPDRPTIELYPYQTVITVPGRDRYRTTVGFDGSRDGEWVGLLQQFLREHEPAPTILPSTGRHVFISYSRTDRSYVDRLDRHLIESGIETWVDRRGIGAGDRWDNTLRDALDACSALVVVMTPRAEESRGVRREILYVEDEGKTIVPLLLEGKRWWSLAEIQYEEVTDGSMPSDEFVEGLRRLMSG
jgi:hypothetical protein